MRKQPNKPKAKIYPVKLKFSNIGKKKKKPNKNKISEIMKLLNLEMGDKAHSSNEENNNIIR